jgi:hypothetical protein
MDFSILILRCKLIMDSRTVLTVVGTKAGGNGS